ncbi:myosin-11-like [Rhopilema esculentum]|uniref:myosin-11-like n=1 Tax=Rhopilema esculentum TaxID=499914 RepID=UPI0031E1BA54|eukprot:gene8263-14212_t
MATAAHLDRGVKAGFIAIKGKMADMSENIKELEEKEKRCIEERNMLKKKTREAFAKMTELTMLTGEKEENLRKATEKLKYSLNRLEEKQGHLARLGEWNKSITQIPAEQITQTEENLRVVKTNYFTAREKLAAARARIMELEMNIEKQENKLADLSRKEEQVEVQLEHQSKECELKKTREAKQENVANSVEGRFHEMEQQFYSSRRRRDVASVRLKELEMQMSNSELRCEEFKKKRVAMESTLRELLSSYSKCREVQPPPKYPQAGTAVNSSR